MGSISRKPVYFKTVSLFVILTFFLTNITFAQGPGSLVVHKNDFKAKIVDSNEFLSPVPRVFGKGALDQETRAEMGKWVEDGSLETGGNRFVDHSVEVHVHFWINKGRTTVCAGLSGDAEEEAWKKYLRDEALWDEDVSTYIVEYIENIPTPAGDDSTPKVSRAEFKELKIDIINTFDEFRRREILRYGLGRIGGGSYDPAEGANTTPAPKDVEFAGKEGPKEGPTTAGEFSEDSGADTGSVILEAARKFLDRVRATRERESSDKKVEPSSDPEALQPSPKRSVSPRISDIQLAKNTSEYKPFTVAAFAAKWGMDVQEAEEFLKEVWLKNDNFEKIKDGNGNILFLYSPISQAVQIPVGMKPEDFPTGVPMHVIIGHSEVRDYLNASTEDIRKQLDEFLAAGFKVVLPWGDFPITYGGKNYLESGQRKFPIAFIEAYARQHSDDPEYAALRDEVAPINRMSSVQEIKESLEEYYVVLESTIKAELEKLLPEKNDKWKVVSDKFRERVSEFSYHFEFITSDGGAKFSVSRERVIESFTKIMMNDLGEVKRGIIKEISNIHEINSQIRVLYPGLTLDRIKYQITNAYEPIEGIKTVAITNEAQELRKKRMLPVLEESGIPAEVSGEVADDILYGGGANEENIVAVGDVWGGAFIGRAILKALGAVSIAKSASMSKKKKLTVINNFKAARTGPFSEYYEGYKEAGIDLRTDVKLIHGVSLLDAAASFKELQGEDITGLFDDASEYAVLREITIVAGRTEATEGIGAFTAHHSAEYLRSAGVTRAIVNPFEDYALKQAFNLIKAGITVVLSIDKYGPRVLRYFKRDLEKMEGFEKEVDSEYISLESDIFADQITPIHKVRETKPNPRKRIKKGKQRPIRVPPGFTITTKETKKYLAAGKDTLRPELVRNIIANIAKLEKATGMKFGDKVNPLFVSVRSGAAVSMPGMMDTVLNIGINDKTVEALTNKFGDARFAWDTYRRGMMLQGIVMLGLEKDRFDAIFNAKKAERNVTKDSDLLEVDLRDVVGQFKQYIKDKTGKDFEQDVYKQLEMATKAVFDSTLSENARTYRRLHNISLEDSYSAVNIQSMVFGNLNDNSATGVVFTRNKATGKKGLHGEFLINAQGDPDLVAGVRTPMPISIAEKEEFLRLHPEYEDREDEIITLEEKMPDIYKELEAICLEMDEHNVDMQDIEFTVQDGVLYMLQIRPGKRSGIAALNILMDLYEEGKISIREAIQRLTPAQDEELLNRILDPDDIKRAKADKKHLTTGLAASPGAVVGKVIFDPEEAEKLRNKYPRDKFPEKKFILVRPETTADDIAGIAATDGILTEIGGLTSHAAVVALSMGKTAVVGAGEIDVEEDYFIVKGIRVNKKDIISIDGFTGEVFLGDVKTKDSVILDGMAGKELATEDQKLYERYIKFFEWVEAYRGKDTVRANADTPGQVRTAMKYFGADGLGLIRTEHMFFEDRIKGENRLHEFRKMILRDDITVDSLAELGDFQIADFIEILEIVEGKPIAARLLDPPLHEFLPKPGTPKGDKAIHALVRDKKLGMREADILAKIDEMKEVNPMAGLRGVRLAIKNPAIPKMQTRWLFEAYKAVKDAEKPVSPIEILLPLVNTVEEFKILEDIITGIAKNEYGYTRGEDYLITAMIETPSGALNAGEIAKRADGLSFGTNDLTQFILKFCRDSAGNKVIPVYMGDEFGFLKVNPFATIDDIVAEYVKMATALARRIKPNIKIGICGVQGGDEVSIKETIIPAGLTYTSPAPGKVHGAKLAYAQKYIRDQLAGRDSVEPYDFTKLEMGYADIKPARVNTVEEIFAQDETRSADDDRDVEEPAGQTGARTLIRRLILSQASSAFEYSEELDPHMKGISIKLFEYFANNAKEALLDDNNAMFRLFNQDLFSIFEDMTGAELAELADYFEKEVEQVTKAIGRLREVNRSMGNRGIRQFLTGHESIFRAQLAGIFHTLQTLADEKSYKPRIIVPLLINDQEFKHLMDIVDEMLREFRLDRSKISLGASIETVNAVGFSGEIAELADFFVYDTIGLTESVKAMTREDANDFLKDYMQKTDIYLDHPFKVVHRDVLIHIGMSVRRAQLANPEIPFYYFGHDELSLDELPADELAISGETAPPQADVSEEPVAEEDESQSIHPFGTGLDGKPLTEKGKWKTISDKKGDLGGKGLGLRDLTEHTYGMDKATSGTPPGILNDTFQVMDLSDAESVSGTGGASVKVEGAFKRLREGGGITEARPVEFVDKITLTGKEVRIKEFLPIIGGRNYSVIIHEGAARIRLGDNEYVSAADGQGRVQTFTAGNEDVIIVDTDGIVLPGLSGSLVYSFADLNISDLVLEKVGDGPLILEIVYEHTEREQLSYEVYKTVRKHSAMLRDMDQGIDLIAPNSMLGGTDVSQMEKNLDESFGKDRVKIKGYNTATGLEQIDVITAISNSVRAGRIPILVATKSSIKASAQTKDTELCNAMELTRLISIPDLKNLDSEAWFFAEDIARIALLQANLKASDIKEKTSFASDMQKLMTLLTGRSVAMEDLFLMLPFTDEGIPAEFKVDNPYKWMLQSLKRLLLRMPMIPYDAKGEFEKRLRIMYAA